MSFVRRAYVSRLPVCMPAVVLALLGGGGLSSSCAEPKKAATAPGLCTREALASGTVVRVVDGRTFVLADGPEVRTAGIEVPPLPHPNRDGPASPAVIGSVHPSDNTGAVAPGALRALVTGREVVLTGPTSAMDRYGRLLVEVAVSSNGVAGSITNFVVAQGLARLAAHAGRAACVSELRTTSGAAKLGLWGNPRYFPRADEDAAGISAERGRFTLVEGRIAWRESGGTIYVNFGRPWSEDFTVTIAKRKDRQFAAAGLDSRALTGRHVLVRGWIEECGGPSVVASAPEQIEIVAEKYKDRCTGCG